MSQNCKQLMQYMWFVSLLTTKEKLRKIRIKSEANDTNFLRLEL